MNERSKGKPKWTEFECPECSANNPWHDGFEVGDQLFCGYCGAVLIVKRTDDPERFKLVLD
jgi:DNA-directed RNA polymerase subunit RPC12/RpoP